MSGISPLPCSAHRQHGTDPDLQTPTLSSPKPLPLLRAWTEFARDDRDGRGGLELPGQTALRARGWTGAPSHLNHSTWEEKSREVHQAIQDLMERPGLGSHLYFSGQVFTSLLLEHHEVQTLHPQAGHPSPLHLFQAGPFQRMQSYRSPIKSKLKHRKQMGQSVEALTADGTKILN